MSREFNIPFFMLDLSNYQLILSIDSIPSDIKDTKEIVLVENPIPGRNYQPITYGGGGNRKISFTLPLVRKNDKVGNVFLLKQFEMLRNQAQGFLNIFSGQFVPTPKVLFYWGIGSVPLPYWVRKCDATHKQGWVNRFGIPQYSEIDIELWLDESSVLYRAEEIYRRIASIIGIVQTAKELQGKKLV
jgi:hypothetical protein